MTVVAGGGGVRRWVIIGCWGCMTTAGCAVGGGSTEGAEGATMTGVRRPLREELREERCDLERMMGGLRRPSVNMTGGIVPDGTGAMTGCWTIGAGAAPAGCCMMTGAWGLGRRLLR